MCYRLNCLSFHYFDLELCVIT